MFDSFLSCLLFSLVLATVNVIVQMSIIGRDKWLMLQDAWMTPMSAMTGVSVIPLFLGSAFVSMLVNALMIWLFPTLAWTYVITMPLSVLYMRKIASRVSF